jgi:two-component system sensor histidine kinase KdpD
MEPTLEAPHGCEVPVTDRFLQLAEALREGVAVVRGGRVVWASDTLAELCGRRRADELVGSDFRELFKDTGRGLPEPHGSAALACAVHRTDGECEPVACRRAGRSGDEEIWVVENPARVRMLEAELLVLSRRLHDVNREVASLEERLRVERVDRDELLAVVSHELRTPVTVIHGYLRLLLSEEVGPLAEEPRRFVAESAKACQRLDAMIENLLRAPRASAGDAVLEVSTGSLSETVASVAGLLEPLLARHGMRIEVAIPVDADRARFDRQRVEQVLTNLVGNAIKYAPEGEVVAISARRTVAPAGPDGRERPFVAVSVSDAGPGIAEADRERIFDAYVQAGDGSRVGGLGLGLAVCRRLVESHGGSISVENRAEGGSRFEFTLPAGEDR